MPPLKSLHRHYVLRFANSPRLIINAKPDIVFSLAKYPSNIQNFGESQTNPSSFLQKLVTQFRGLRCYSVGSSALRINEILAMFRVAKTGGAMFNISPWMGTRTREVLYIIAGKEFKTGVALLGSAKIQIYGNLHRLIGHVHLYVCIAIHITVQNNMDLSREATCHLFPPASIILFPNKLVTTHPTRSSIREPVILQRRHCNPCCNPVFAH